MSKTEEALKEAFAGESQANRKYLAFAAKADQEGHPQAARLFRAAAEAETIHAHNHLRALKAIHGTRENLQEAVAGESHEFKSMYPAMIESAKAEGNKEAEKSFNYANEVEKVHARLYQQMLVETGEALARLIPIMSAPSAAIQPRGKRLPRSVRSVTPRERCSRRWSSTAGMPAGEWTAALINSPE